VIDPLISKRQQLLLATQLCRMVLKVRNNPLSRFLLFSPFQYRIYTIVFFNPSFPSENPLCAHKLLAVRPHAQILRFAASAIGAPLQRWVRQELSLFLYPVPRAEASRLGTRRVLGRGPGILARTPSLDGRPTRATRPLLVHRITGFLFYFIFFWSCRTWHDLLNVGHSLLMFVAAGQ
jgi:hypothetical protein